MMRYETEKRFIVRKIDLNCIRMNLLLMFVFIGHSVSAYIPKGYYAGLNGKCCAELKTAVYTAIAPHTELGYDYLWEYYYLTYMHPDEPHRVLDMYSDSVAYFNSGKSVQNVEKEHCVPKSWWGGDITNAPACDLYNVIPSNAEANKQKGDFPLGVVTDVAPWGNGVSKVGKGIVGNKLGKLFEPDDRYKGDFARIYFYMATCYPNISWVAKETSCMSASNPLTIDDWILPTLIAWNKTDPVDSTEILRNENVFALQHNRNPFIDYPELVDYIWGDRRNEAFDLSCHAANETSQSAFRAAVPVFSVIGGNIDAPKDVVTGTQLKITGGTTYSTLHYRVNDGAWDMQDFKKGYNASTATTYYSAPQFLLTVDSETVIDAYCTHADREPSDTITYYYKPVDYSDMFLLYETFDGIGGNNASTSGSSAKWNGNVNFVPGEKVFCAGNAIRLGTASSTGSITSRNLDFDGGTLKIRMEVKGWTKVEGELSVSLTGSQKQTLKYTATMNDDWEPVTLTFSGVAASPVVSISTSEKRAFINFISVEAEEHDGIYQPHIYLTHHYYTIHGQRLVNRPTSPGIYIVNGRKVIIYNFD